MEKYLFSRYVEKRFSLNINLFQFVTKGVYNINNIEWNELEKEEDFLLAGYFSKSLSKALIWKFHVYTNFDFNLHLQCKMDEKRVVQ